MDRIDGGVYWRIVCLFDRGRQLAPLVRHQSVEMVIIASWYICYVSEWFSCCNFRYKRDVSDLWPLQLGPNLWLTTQQPTIPHDNMQQKTLTWFLPSWETPVASYFSQPLRCHFLNTAGAKAMFGSCREGAVPSDETTGSRNARVGETAYVKKRQGETEREQTEQARQDTQSVSGENEVTLRRDRS